MKKQKICWKITTKCNQNCKYCFGFSNIKELSYNDNEKVLDNLIESGLTDITWTGGEAVMYSDLNKLIKRAKEKGIHNKLVTNGIFLSKNDNKYVDDILNKLDSINISIDSISNDINLELGKENNHFEIVQSLLEKIKKMDIKIGINTVISKKNVNYIEELGEFLNNYKIDTWKFLKFMPVRERALRNRKLFEISENELENKVRKLKEFENIKIVRYKKQREFEKSIVILPNADIVLTQNGKDNYLGNVLKQGNIDFNKINKLSKITTLVAHNDKNVINQITNSINKLDYAYVVATATNETDMYKKIVDLKPEMVFAKSDMSSLEILEKSKEQLNDKIPVFNILTNKIADNQIEKMYDIIGSNLNAIVSNPCNEEIGMILEQYKQYKDDE